MHNTRAYLIDAKHRESRYIQHVHQRRQHIAKFIVERSPIRAAEQIAPVPANDIALLQQSLAEKGGIRLVVPQRGIVQIDQTQVRGDQQHTCGRRSIWHSAQTG